MMISISQLVSIMPNAAKRVDTYIDPLNAAMQEFFINTKERQSAFLSQIAHESGQLLYVEEIASGAAYEGRADLGNEVAGDGVKFKGRGLIQVTGRANYAAVEMALGIDCLNTPNLLCTPINACRSSAWWWREHGLNELADSGQFQTITRRINGGLNGEADREAFYAKAKKVLGVV